MASETTISGQFTPGTREPSSAMPQGTRDQACLQRIASPDAAGSRQALEELTHRHLDMVYSSALRQLGNSHLAEDVTQAVFLILSQKAHTIRAGVAVGGWLLAVTRRTAVHAMKRRSADERHERALAKPELAAEEEASWEAISPVLDAALSRLPQKDRDAIVLRVLENQSLAAVGAVLGISEDTAGKRVERALARLKTILQKHAITAPAAALTATLSTQAVHAAPAHLLTATLSGNVSTTVAALAQGTLRAMAWGTAKLVAATALAFLVLTLLSAVTFGYARGSPAGSRVPPAVTSPVAPPADPPPTLPPAPYNPAAPTAFRTVDWIPAPNVQTTSTGTKTKPNGMATDPAGTVFAVGVLWNEAGVRHGILRQLCAGHTQWETTFESATSTMLTTVAVGPNGNLYISDNGSRIYQRPAGASNFLDLPTELPPASARVTQITTDAAGNVYTAGYMGQHWVVRKQTLGVGDFVTVDDLAFDTTARTNAPGNVAYAITGVGGKGPSAGIYAAGRCQVIAGSNEEAARVAQDRWYVRKSTDAGATWVTVDDFVFNPTVTGEANKPVSIGWDSAGNVYVTGRAYEEMANRPGTLRKSHWITRKSATGDAGSWTIDDDFAPQAVGDMIHICAGPDGVMYAVGTIASDPAGHDHGIIRTNFGGSWHTLDDFQVPNSSVAYTAITIGPFGHLYVGGSIEGETSGWFIRSTVPATAPAALTNLSPSRP